MDYSKINEPYNFKSDDGGLSYPPKSYMDEVAELASNVEPKQLNKIISMFTSLFN